MSEVKPDIKERIEKAAQALLERGEKPTVDAVRRLAKSSMGDTLVVMRVWRLAHSVAPVSVATAVPETVTKAFGTVVVQMWSEAQALANTGRVAPPNSLAYRKGRRAVEEDAYNAVLADPVEARAAAGCVSSSEVQPIGNGKYMVIGRASGGLNAGKETTEATKEANAYCSKIGK